MAALSCEGRLLPPLEHFGDDGLRFARRFRAFAGFRRPHPLSFEEYLNSSDTSKLTVYFKKYVSLLHPNDRRDSCTKLLTCVSGSARIKWIICFAKNHLRCVYCPTDQDFN